MHDGFEIIWSASLHRFINIVVLSDRVAIMIAVLDVVPNDFDIFVSVITTLCVAPTKSVHNLMGGST